MLGPKNIIYRTNKPRNVSSKTNIMKTTQLINLRTTGLVRTQRHATDTTLKKQNYSMPLLIGGPVLIVSGCAGELLAQVATTNPTPRQNAL